MRNRRSSCVTILLLTLIPVGAEASPYLLSEIAVGATVTGMFSYDTSSVASASDTGYALVGGANVISVTIGTTTFATSLTAPNALVRVTDGSFPGNSDFIRISSLGDNDSFSGYLSNFARQDPALDPIGDLSLNFHFPNTYLSDRSLPASFDPSQTSATSPRLE